jgi:hypothetical protein
MSDDPGDDFRWQALFQRSSEPLFVLNRARRIVFVNRAWEALTGLPLPAARGLVCKRRRNTAEADLPEAVGHVLAPPAEALAGTPVSVRRPAPTSSTVRAFGRSSWDVAFFPLAAGAGLGGILGKIIPGSSGEGVEQQPLPEKISNLRDRFRKGFGLEMLSSQAPATQRLTEQVRLAGQTAVSVLLVGEPGTGKHWLARCIHQYSRRSQETFAMMDAARLPAQAIAGLLFAQGGFGRPLRPGTLYLREPAALPPEMQARLADLIASWAPEGDGHGPRVIAGMQQDPDLDLKAGRLLPQLHALLGTLMIRVPPLRERLADLDGLMERLLPRAAAAANRAAPALTGEARDLLCSHLWPGNCAELFEALCGACMRARGERIEASDLPFYLRAVPPPPPHPLPLDTLLEQVERRLIGRALKQSGNNKTEAAQLLGIWRQRLLRRMEALGIDDRDAGTDSHEANSGSGV